MFSSLDFPLVQNISNYYGAYVSKLEITPLIMAKNDVFTENEHFIWVIYWVSQSKSFAGFDCNKSNFIWGICNQIFDCFIKQKMDSHL